jgi:hypothetical protein
VNFEKIPPPFYLRSVFYTFSMEDATDHPVKFGFNAKDCPALCIPAG